MHKLWKILKKVIGFLVIIVLFSAFLTLSYIYLKKDDIASGLLSRYNEQIQGKIYFKDIAIEPFVHFPQISFALEDFRLYESSEGDDNILTDPIAEFDNVYLAIDLIDLLDDIITITSVSLEGGYVDLIRNRNNKYNFQLALGEKKKASKKVKTKRKRKKRISKKKENKELFVESIPNIDKSIKLNLNEINIHNTHLEFNNQKNGNQINQFFYSLKAYLSIMPDSIITTVYSKSVLKEMPLGKNLKLQDIDYTINTTLRISRKDSLTHIEPSQLILSKAKFNINGFFDVKDNGLLDLEIEGADKGLGFISHLLSKKGLENVRNGNLFFNGHINGTFKDEIPNIQFSFGLRDLSIGMPESTDSINNVKIIGVFKSGRKMDFSEALLQVDTLNGQLPNGYIEGNFIAQDLTQPYLNYKVKLKSQIKDFDKIIRQNVIDSLSGSIELNDEFEGILDPKLGWNDKKKGNLRIQFDSVSFRIKDSLKISHLEGNITDKNSKIQLNNIRILTDSSDLVIKGTIKNLPNLFFDEGKKIKADLKINTSTLKFSEFQIGKKSNSQNINYTLKNSRFRIIAEATKKELTEFKHLPVFLLKIKPSVITISGITNPIKVSGGSLKSSYKNDSHSISLNYINLKSKSGETIINGDWKLDSIKSNILRLNLTTINFIPNEFLLNKNNNKLLKQKFNSEIQCKLTYKNDNEQEIESLMLHIKRIKFSQDNNIYKSKNIKIKGENLRILNNEKSFLTKIGGKLNLSIEKLERNNLKFANKQYEVNANEGIFHIYPLTDSLFNSKVKGEIILSPYTRPPMHSVNLRMHGIQLGPVQNSIVKDSLFSGKVNAQLSLSFSGLQKDSILNSLKGTIKIRGKNIELSGLNFDKFLNNYKENHELDLTNIGLKVYPGAINWFNKKKFKSAWVNVTNRKKTSLIKQLILDWKICGDTIFTEDVALTTLQNRIALKGNYRILSDSLDFDIGLLDDKSCSLIKHKINGLGKKPEFQDFNLFETPDKKSNKKAECKPFYTGRLEHPKASE